jgi:hypothetical protein
MPWMQDLFEIGPIALRAELAAKVKIVSEEDLRRLVQLVKVLVP